MRIKPWITLLLLITVAVPAAAGDPSPAPTPTLDSVTAQLENISKTLDGFRHRLDTKGAQEIRLKVYRFLARHLAPPKPFKDVKQLHQAGYRLPGAR